MKYVAVEVVGAQILQRILEGVGDLCFQTRRRVIGKRLVGVLSRERGEPGLALFWEDMRSSNVRTCSEEIAPRA